MFSIAEMDPGFGHESRSIKPSFGVLTVVVVVGFVLWLAGAIGSRATRRQAGEDD
jgi:hypothetical protein